MAKTADLTSQTKEHGQVNNNPDWLKQLLDTRKMSYEQLEKTYYMSGSLVMVIVLSVFSFLMGYLNP